MTATQTETSAVKTLQILIVEDNEALSVLMQKRLTQSGYGVILANTGNMALDMLDKHKINLLLLDYKLPDMNAIDLVKILQQENRNIPFVIVTGVGDERTAVEFMKLGAKDYLVKDTNLLDFLPAVAARIKEELLTHERLSFTENALLESEQRYRLLVENIDLGIILINTDYQIVTANAAIGRMLNKPAHSMIGNNIFTEIPFNYENISRETIRKMVISDTPLDNETELLVSSHKNLRVRLRSFPYFLSGEIVGGYINVFEDITEQKFLEEQLIQAQKMEAVGMLAGGISHDFNNLLTAIQGHAELALMDIHEENNLYQEITGITRSVKMGSELTNQLLLFSRRQELQLKEISLNEVIRNILHMLNRVIDKTIILEIQLEENLPRIKADNSNMEQVILNLAINAQDAMPDGGKLCISTATTEIDEAESKKFTNATPGKYILLSVNDTGIGVNMEDMKRIFEPFFTTKKEGKGTGLGLSIVYSIVNKHNGIIDVSSSPNQGSVFNIYFQAINGAV